MICDRCGTVIIEHGSTIEATSGDARCRYREPISLCQDCVDHFIGWLMSKRPLAGHRGPAVATAGPPFRGQPRNGR